MKTVLITGASKGIGRATAILFSQKGWNVAAAVREIDTEEQYPENVCPFIIDIRDRESINRCIEQVVNYYGRVDLLVNNAGVYSTSPLECISEEDLDNVIQTNVKGTLYMTQAMLPYFRTNKGGTIVNISSIAGRVTFPFQSVYHTSKWAIEGLSESLYYELKNLKIKVKIVEPGMVHTSLYRSVLDMSAKRFPMEYRENFAHWHSYLINNYDNGYDPILDARRVYQAANDRSSRLRYTSDSSTKFVLILRRIFPTCILQRLIYSICKLK